MRNHPNNRRAFLAVIAGLALVAGSGLLAPAAMAEKIGVTSAVTPTVTGTPPGAEQRVLAVGLDIQRNERVVTTHAGLAQLLFLDGTALTLGPDSKVVLDRFVYDPDRRSGDIALDLAGGALRLVGGEISKTHPIQVRTPVATVGIRGGIAIVLYEPGQPLKALFLFGKDMSVTAGGIVVNAFRPGSIVTVGQGQGPSPARLANLHDVNAMLTLLVEKTGRPAAAVFIDQVDRAASHTNDLANSANAPPIGGNPANSSDAARPGASAGLLPAGVTLCTCSFLNWAFLEGATQRATTSTPEANATPQIVGTVANPASLPNMGSATYQGQISGDVEANNRAYFASGSFQQTWSFASRSGSLTINQFDGTNFKGTASSPASAANPADFTGNFSGTKTGVGALSGTLSGSFLQSAGAVSGQPPASMGGSFAISGSAYRASGTFSAHP